MRTHSHSELEDCIQSLLNADAGAGGHALLCSLLEEGPLVWDEEGLVFAGAGPGGRSVGWGRVWATAEGAAWTGHRFESEDRLDGLLGRMGERGLPTARLLGAALEKGAPLVRDGGVWWIRAALQGAPAADAAKARAVWQAQLAELGHGGGPLWARTLRGLAAWVASRHGLAGDA